VFKIQIKGLDKLQRHFEDAQDALSALDGELGVVRFNPSDPSSIDAAILEVEQMVDERVGSYGDNPIIAPVAAQMKARYREAILDRAAAARLQQGED
jgi:hypothetical protein